MNILQKSITICAIAIGCAGCTCLESENKIQVFNGKNLDGWDIFFSERKVNENPNNLVSVKNGELECVFKNGEVDVFLNGVFVNHLDNYFPRVEKLQLQSEGAEIVFRKVEVQPL